MEVERVDCLSNRLQSDFIGLAERVTGVGPAAGQALGVAPRVVVASIAALAVWRSPCHDSESLHRPTP